MGEHRLLFIASILSCVEEKWRGCTWKRSPLKVAWAKGHICQMDAEIACASWGQARGVKTGKESRQEPRQPLFQPLSCLCSEFQLYLCKNSHDCPQRLCLFTWSSQHWLISDPGILWPNSRRHKLIRPILHLGQMSAHSLSNQLDLRTSWGKWAIHFLF